MSVIAFERTFLTPLRAEGYFVDIFTEGEEPGTLIVDCSMYLTDTDESGAPSNPFCIEIGDATHTANNRCVCCEQLPQNPRQWSKGSIMCPICCAWTAPWTIRKRTFHGLFKLVPGEAAILLPRPSTWEGEHSAWMTNEHQIACISEALRYASDWYFTKEEDSLVGWSATQARLRAMEAAEEAAFRRDAEQPWLTAFTLPEGDKTPELEHPTE